MSYCIIGDVHGEFRALENLVAKIPNNSKLIFVGDLVDRGSQSAHVVRYVRENKLACVMGNHELMMIEHGSSFIDDVMNNRAIEQENMWLKNGGKETLLSYGLVTIENNQMVPHHFIKEFIFQFEDDIQWMKTLPLYLELNTRHSSGRSVVVSHSAIASVWQLRHNIDETSKRKLRDMVLWSRVKPFDNEPIFNVFGHTPQKYSADVSSHYVNIDTGCYMKQESGFGVLSAYCVETEEIFSSSELRYEKAS
jgi:serine/threonine protein phosphatase 1